MIVRLLILALVALTAWGQSFGGRIVGVVTDSSTAAMPQRRGDRNE